MHQWWTFRSPIPLPRFFLASSSPGCLLQGGVVNPSCDISCPLCPRQFNRNGIINHLWRKFWINIYRLVSLSTSTQNWTRVKILTAAATDLCKTRKYSSEELFEMTIWVWKVGYCLLPTSDSCANINLANHKVSFIFLVLLSHLLRVRYISVENRSNYVESRWVVSQLHSSSRQ